MVEFLFGAVFGIGVSFLFFHLVDSLKKDAIERKRRERIKKQKEQENLEKTIRKVLEEIK